MRIRNIDLSLYLVTDRSLSRGRSTFEIVKAAVQGGVTCVQLRDKKSSTRQFLQEAMSLRDFLKSLKIPLIINDRLDIAMAAEADGVHLGQDDLPLKLARKIVKEKMIIGISVESVDDAVKAQTQGADYVSASPIYSTPTKPDTAPPLGLAGLIQIRNAVTIPLVGIGGIHLNTLEPVIRHGANGIAVVSAIVSAVDPEAETRKLKQAILTIRNAESQ
ncbi:MAG: thiamine phosphate synthase [Thermodesulfobacteriota bacterium]